MLQFSSQCHVSNYVWKIPISHAQEELIAKGFKDETTNAAKQTSFLTIQPVVLARFWFQTFPDNPCISCIVVDILPPPFVRSSQGKCKIHALMVWATVVGHARSSIEAFNGIGRPVRHFRGQFHGILRDSHGQNSPIEGVFILKVSESDGISYHKRLFITQVSIQFWGLVSVKKGDRLVGRFQCRVNSELNAWQVVSQIIWPETAGKGIGKGGWVGPSCMGCLMQEGISLVCFFC